MPLVPDEAGMWSDDNAEVRRSLTDAELDTRFERANRRLTLEVNRKSLESLYEDIRCPGFIVESGRFPRRRAEWSVVQRSSPMESFILNVPVPPLYLLAVGRNAYEVIDGQQRIRAIREFFSSSLVLTGLRLCPELNGLRFDVLPHAIRRLVERRNLEYTVVIPDPSLDSEEMRELIRSMFIRLSNGGSA